MTNQQSTLASFFPFHDALLRSAVDGMTPEQWTKRPTPTTNHPVWILTHLNGVRRQIARNLGADIEDAADATTASFGDDCLDASRYPAPDALTAEFVALGERIATLLADAGDATLAANFEPDFPDGRARTRGAAFTFLLAHEALHLGQVSFIRRMYDHPGVAEGLLREMAEAEQDAVRSRSG